MGCSLQDKEKDITIVNPFQKIIDSSTRKPNKIWIDKGREFYKNSSRKWLKDNDIEIHSAHDKGIFVVAERFIRNLNNKIYKHITAASKIVYIDKIYDIINEYNNTHHRTIKMKPIKTKDNIYILTLLRKLMIKILNSKLVIMLEYENIKTFLLKDVL